MVDFAPGMRTIIRDEEWMIKKIETNSLGNKTLYCVGVSPLVKDREAIFLADLEQIQVVDPAEVKLVADHSPFYKRALLYLESQWRQQIPTDSNLHIGHRAAMDLMPYQLDPAKLSLQRPRQRILIADTVGLGKTLEAGILMSELIARGKGKRILVVTVKSMMTQFQKEMVSEEQNTASSVEDLSAALDVPTTLKSFVVVEGEDELRRIMAEPLEKWRVFLHPTQRKIVQKEYSGSARVLGGAGTGKTVVAMHKAKYLASKCEGQQRILVTTFTANLAADIRENLRKICTLEELRRIEITHLDAWVNQFLRESGFSAQIGYDDAIDPLWERAILLANNDLPFEVSFYKEEWNRVVIAQEALTIEKYVKATRNGRGTRLDRKKRIQIWKVFENYQNLMKENQIRDINTAMYESTKLLQAAGRKPRYSSIIIDEGQDFSDNAYRLIRALAGEEHPNDIFIVGDSHQRIYRNHPILSKCGINVRGRSSILKINYRTTEEIRKHAFALLNGISFDDLDEGLDIGDKCQSLTHGEKPIIKNFSNANDEFDFILSEVKKLKNNGVALTDICVVARTKKLVDDYIALFTGAGIRSYAIKRNKVDDRGFDGLRVATMHRVKGLEFEYVFVAAVNNRIIPLPSAINKTDVVSEAESITSEKCLLYVAMTRAQKGVYITSYGKKSDFLKP